LGYNSGLFKKMLFTITGSLRKQKVHRNRGRFDFDLSATTELNDEKSYPTLSSQGGVYLRRIALMNRELFPARNCYRDTVLDTLPNFDVLRISSNALEVNQG
jgi:hypothetical protein